MQDYVGDEVLKGSIILDAMKQAERDRNSNEETAADYARMAAETTLETLSVYYNYQSWNYIEQAKISQKIFEKWKEKEDKYDEIENVTSNLFSLSADMRSVIVAGISDIAVSFKDGKYSPNMSSPWRSAMLKETQKMTSIDVLLRQAGLTGEEAAYLTAILFFDATVDIRKALSMLLIVVTATILIIQEQKEEIISE